MMTRPGLLAVFTEGDRVRGLGHISRCSAYAQAWSSRGGQVCWVLDGDDAAFASIGPEQAVWKERWQDGGPVPLSVPAEVVLIDSYEATFEAMAAIADVADMAVFIDDLERTYPPGIVVHPAPGGAAERPLSGGSRWLLGPAWQPLRPPFWDPQPRADIRPEIERILVVFGGGDIRVLGVEMARLAHTVCPAAKIDLVLGSNQSMQDAWPGLSVHRAIDAAAMVSLMLQADLAISAAGQTVFELARCGTPAVLLGVADNQQTNLDQWPALCGYVGVGQWNVLGREDRVRAGIVHLAGAPARRDVSRRAAALVDGQGVRRLLDHLEQTKVGARA